MLSGVATCGGLVALETPFDDPSSTVALGVRVFGAVIAGALGFIVGAALLRRPELADLNRALRGRVR